MNIVLDLDETLVSVTTRPVGVPDFEFTIEGSRYFARKRPHLGLFLSFVFKHFLTVNIWTAATAPYAAHVIDNILSPRQKARLGFVLSREALEISPDGGMLKPLAKIYRGNIRPDNTLMIDDREAVVMDNPGNSIIVPAWRGKQDDNALARLIIVLDSIIGNADIFDFGRYPVAFNLDQITK